MTDCQICGTRFGNRSCTECAKSICSSCVSREGTKCIRCQSNRIVSKNFLKNNFPYIIFFIALWVFVSGFYPFPYLIASGMPVDMDIMEPVIIATSVMTIPFIFMLIAWKKKSWS
ncbi:MAG TPA: hypothetical protein VF220_00875 [Nitrososphaeraceae archaeon]